MAVTSAVSCDWRALPPGVVAAIGETVNQSTFDLLRARLKEELTARHLPEGTGIDSLADYFATLMSGMAVMGKMGVSKQRLFDAVELALTAVPG
ncbi:MAG: hypothetical protein KDH88_02310 [Chromatiales bacterium]|nr:hypothetical protein [Chromatiales bacterium]